MRIAQHISEVIGNTPLVQLNSVVPPGSGRVVAKVVGRASYDPARRVLTALQMITDNASYVWHWEGKPTIQRFIAAVELAP